MVLIVEDTYLTKKKIMRAIHGVRSDDSKKSNKPNEYTDGNVDQLVRTKCVLV